MLYLIRYSEIFLKSEFVKKRWEETLIRNIKRVLDCKVRRERGRIWVVTDDEKAKEKLKKVFGIVSFSECYHCKLDELNDFVVEFCKKIGIDKAKTFAVRVKRVGEHDFTSQQKSAELGAIILKAFQNLKVNLDDPEKTIFVEIRNQDCYLFHEVIKGVGGIPLGVEGKLVSLFSGGIDSPVATWMMMKRGCKIVPIYFDCNPFTDETTLRRAKAVAEILKEYDPDFELRIVEHGKFLLKVKEVLKERRLENYACIFCKRRMYRIAEKIALEENAKGIVTGEAMGQVATQTLDNLMVLNEACKIPVYRPLIGLDKIEIEELARKIGTYEASIMPAKDCTAVPKKPTTKAKLEKVIEIEKELNFYDFSDL
jgi:thiamine biosynthesis protein ThiI